jgi:hypothetical protein
MRPATRTLQTLRGLGQVFAGSTYLCDARYAIAVHQGIVYAGSQPRAGATDIRGTLVVVDGEQSWKLGTRLSLRLEDGRTAACVTSTESIPASLYEISVSALSGRPSSLPAGLVEPP